MTTFLSYQGPVVRPGAVRKKMPPESWRDFEVFIDGDGTTNLRRINLLNRGLMVHSLASS